MGVAASQPTSENTSNESQNKEENTISGLHGKIIETGNKLIKKYKDKFLNEDFCESLQFVMGKKLAELDVDSLEKLNDKITSGISVFRKADESKDQKYILKSLGDNLDKLDDLRDYFEGNIDLDEKSNITIPRGLKYKYINEKIRNGLIKELNNYNQKGGENNSPDEDDEENENATPENADDNSPNTPDEDNSDEDNSDEDNSDEEDIDEEGEEEEKKNNKNTPKTPEDKQKEQIVKRIQTIQNNSNKSNALKESDEIYKKIKKLTKEIDGFESSDDNEETEPNKEMEQNQNKNMESTKERNNTNTESNERQNKNESPEKLSRNGYKIIKYKKRGEKSVFTKSMLCRAISDHYKIRINIIAAILSVIPYNYKNTELSGFCEDRLRALREGTICMPDSSLEKMRKYSVEEGIQKLSKTINNFTKGKCERFRGFLMKLSTEQLESLKKGSTGLNKQYKDSYLALKNNYRDNLNKLLDILDELRGVRILNNASLNDLSEKTQDLIQSIYNNCQLHYYNAVIALIHANLNAIKEQKEQEDKEKTVKVFADLINKRTTPEATN